MRKWLAAIIEKDAFVRLFIVCLYKDTHVRYAYIV